MKYLSILIIALFVVFQPAHAKEKKSFPQQVTQKWNHAFLKKIQIKNDLDPRLQLALEQEGVGIYAFPEEGAIWKSKKHPIDIEDYHHAISRIFLEEIISGSNERNDSLFAEICKHLRKDSAFETQRNYLRVITCYASLDNMGSVFLNACAALDQMAATSPRGSFKKNVATLSKAREEVESILAEAKTQEAQYHISAESGHAPPESFIKNCDSLANRMFPHMQRILVSVETAADTLYEIKRAKRPEAPALLALWIKNIHSLALKQADGTRYFLVDGAERRFTRLEILSPDTDIMYWMFIRAVVSIQIEYHGDPTPILIPVPVELATLIKQLKYNGLPVIL